VDVEEGPQGTQPFPSVGCHRPAIDDLVEGSHPVSAQHAGKAAGQPDVGKRRELKGGGAAGVIDLVAGGVLSPDDDPPTQRLAAAQGVHPGDRVPGARGPIGHARHQSLEVRSALRPDPYLCGLYGEQPQRGLQDHPGQAHATGSGPEEVGVRFRADLQGSLRGPQPQRCDMVGEVPVAMLVATVDVRRDRPADGDEAGGGQHGRKPAPGDDRPHQLAHADSRLHRHLALGVVEVPDPVAARGPQHGTAGPLRGIAPAVPRSPGDQPPRRGALE
jgi:hypothetical protein